MLEKMEGGTSAGNDTSKAQGAAVETARPGLTVRRVFTRDGVNPFDEVEWELRDASITGVDGKVYFEQKQVEFPTTWSQTATNVVVQKYFRGTLNTAEREYSVRQMIGHTVAMIACTSPAISARRASPWLCITLLGVSRRGSGLVLPLAATFGAIGAFEISIEPQ